MSHSGSASSTEHMPALDFTEIPQSTSGPGRDSFELLAREVLAFLGFRVLEGPDRGADGGRDLIVEEKRTGIAGETVVRWLVSCKHKAHSGSSVTPGDEVDIQDRLNAHGCAAFLGFYSTVPSSGLAGKLNGAAGKFEHAIFDPERIERELLHSPDGLAIARRFFPQSITKWLASDRMPAKVFAEGANVKCDYCGKSLLHPEPHGIVCVWSPFNRHGPSPKKTEKLYFSCKGRCDDRLKAPMREKDLIDSWEDISDLVNPTVYLRWVIGTMNELRDGEEYSDEAFDKLKDLFINLYPLICRHPSDADNERVRSLLALPGFLGGFG